MQFNPSYLYSNKIDVYTNLGTWTTERYRKVYQRPFKIYKGVDNRLDLQVRNSDQKPKDITGFTPYFNLIKTDSTEILIESRECQIDSASQGRIYVLLTRDDVAELIEGSYHFAMYVEDDNGTRTPLYGDSQYDVIGTIDLVGNVFADGKPDVEPNLYATLSVSNSNLTNVYYSDVFSSFDDRTTHKFDIYASNYSGDVIIEGTNETSTDPAKWEPIVIVPFNAYTNSVNGQNEPIPFTVTVSEKWKEFRIKHGQDNTNTARFTIRQTNNQTYLADVYDGGKDYQVGDIITIAGSALGGVNGVNDLTITVASVSFAGAITDITWTGTSIVGIRSYILAGTGNPTSGTLDKVVYRYYN